MRQQGNMERETTSESDIEEDGNVEVSGVPILLHVRPKRKDPTPKPQATQLKKAPIKVTFAELGPRNGDSDLLSSPDHMPQQDTPSSFSAITLYD